MKSLFAVLTLVFACSTVFGQSTNTTPWPNVPPVGIGTQGSGGPLNALQIHYNSKLVTQRAIMRLSIGDSTNSSTFGILGLDSANTGFCSLARGYDLILHENQGGDLLLTNYTDWGGGAIRMATTPNSAAVTSTPPPTTHDLERVTILSNGNVGIDLPPNNVTDLGKPIDQLQIGGGTVAPIGGVEPLPGLTIYGGNRFEGKLRSDTGIFPIDWRYIAFNEYVDHDSSNAKRSHRIAHVGSSRIAFSEESGGMLHLECAPFDSLRGLDDLGHGTTLEVTGKQGLAFWSYENDTDQFHHLFDIWRPGFTPWPITRNVNGLCVHRTPVIIDTEANVPDFTNFAHLNPDIGDGKTWMLAVNGAALFKEAFVSLDWPDYVFEPNYQLMSLPEVEKYITTNHHLPGVPSADSLAKTGVPLGQTEAKLMEKIEELTRYVIEQNKQIDALRSELDEVKRGLK